MKEVNIVAQFKDGNSIEGTSENFFPGIVHFLLDTTSGESVEINMENWVINSAKISKKISVILSEMRLDVWFLNNVSSQHVQNNGFARKKK